MNTTLLLAANPTVERFSQKTKISTTHSYNGTPCLEWTANSIKQGYGYFWLNGTNQRAHRVAMILAGINPGDLCVLHRCDNPPCVNTSHLFTGTDADNKADMTAKGRANCGRGDRNGSRTKPECLARGEKHGSRTMPERVLRGEKHSCSKLKESDIHMIRQMRSEGTPRQEIADTFHVGIKQIGRILHGKSWAHVPISQVP